MLSTMLMVKCHVVSYIDGLMPWMCSYLHDAHLSSSASPGFDGIIIVKLSARWVGIAQDFAQVAAF